jgi:hypothetical protein
LSVLTRIDGGLELRLPAVATATVTDRVAMRDVAPTDRRWLEDGPLRAATLIRDGFVPVNAAAVTIDGRAVVLVGGPASGRSTVAAALTRRGHGLLADDIVVIDARGDVLPTQGDVKVWPEALALLGMSPTDGDPVRAEIDKRFVRVARGAAAPLVCVVALAVDDGDVRSVTGAARAALVAGHEWFASVVDARLRIESLHRLLSVPLHVVHRSGRAASEIAAEVEGLVP